MPRKANSFLKKNSDFNTESFPNKSYLTHRVKTVWCFLLEPSVQHNQAFFMSALPVQV